MSDFADSYLGRLRALVGPRLLLVPGVRVVVEDGDGGLLLELRSDFRKWGFVGGVPDEREDIVSCAVRETFEETGLHVAGLAPFGFASDPAGEVMTYPNGDACHYFVMLFATRSFSGTLRSDGGENLQLGWFRLGALPEAAMPTVVPTVEAYGRWKATGAFQLL